MNPLWGRVTPDTYGRVRVPCIRCGRMHKLEESWVDFNGPAFRAYYCEPCKEEREGEDPQGRSA